MLELNLREFQEQLRQLQPAKQWVLGFSGGLDSRVLLDLLAKSQSAFESCLQVVHIHHNLQAKADAWADFCQQTAQTYHLPCQIIKPPEPWPAGGGLEERARLARQKIWAAQLGPESVLFLGHHLNDQAETLIMRWCKGAGLAALGGIRLQSQLNERPLLRPLLCYTRAQLEAYAGQNDLVWVQDPSNQHERFERNFIRHQIIPRLLSRFPQALYKMQDAALICQRQASQTQQYLVADLIQLIDVRQRLSISGLLRFEPSYQVDLMRLWLHNFARIGQSKQFWQRLQTEILQARPDKQPKLRYGPFEIRRYQDFLYCCTPLQDLPALPQSWLCSQPWQLENYKLWTEVRVGQGVALTRLPKFIELRLGQAVKRVRPDTWPHHQSLQKCWQILKIPPWLRPRIPLIYVENELIAALGHFVVSDWAAKPNEPGLVFLQEGFF